MSRKIRILMVDDHTIFRSGFAKLLGDVDNFEIIGETSNAPETLEALERGLEPDVITLDINLAGVNSLELIPKLRVIAPQLRILILSMYPKEQFADAAFSAGANGYLSKDATPPELFKAITTLSSGKDYTDNRPSSANSPSAALGLPHERLSDRELEILKLIANGDGLTEIGEKMFLSVKTVSTYRSRVLEKMEMSNNAEIIKYAIAHGLTLSNY